jgi:hypothetical protein
MARKRTRTAKRRTTPTQKFTGRKSISGNPWSRKEIAFMRKYYRNNDTVWVARQLGRSVYSVRYKASDLNIKKAAPSVYRGNKGATSATRKPATRRTTARRTPKRRIARTTRRTTRKSRSRNWRKR